MFQNNILEKILTNQTPKDIAKLLNSCIGTHLPDDVSNADVILCLIYLVRFLSTEEMHYLLGMWNNNSKMEMAYISRLRKKNLIGETTPTKPDSISKKYYYLKPEGFEVTKPLFSADDTQEYKRRNSKGDKNLHDYSAGINLIHLLLYGKPFESFREVAYGLSAATGKVLVGSLRPDSAIRFKCVNMRPQVLFFEEDLGNESASILTDKIKLYNNHNLLDNPEFSSLVFSFRKSYVTLNKYEKDILNANKLRHLSELLYDNEVMDLSSLFLHTNEALHEMGITDTDITCAKQLAKYNNFIPNNKDAENLVNDLTYLDIENIADDIENLSCDLINAQFNKEHNKLTLSRRNQMCGYLLKSYNDNMKGSHLYPILNGYSIWTIPTTLLGNYLPYICIGEETLLQEKISSALSNGYAKERVDFINIITGEHTTKMGRSVVLRNHFKCSTKPYMFSLEYVSRDIGAIIRSKFYIDHIMKYTQYKDSSNNEYYNFLLMMVDDYNDAIFISQLLNYHYWDPKKYLNAVFFVLKDELLGEPPTFNPFIIDENKEKRIIVL